MISSILTSGPAAGMQAAPQQEDRIAMIRDLMCIRQNPETPTAPHNGADLLQRRQSILAHRDWASTQKSAALRELAREMMRSGQWSDIPAARTFLLTCVEDQAELRATCLNLVCHLPVVSLFYFDSIEQHQLSVFILALALGPMSEEEKQQWQAVADMLPARQIASVLTQYLIGYQNACLQACREGRLTGDEAIERIESMASRFPEVVSRRIAGVALRNAAVENHARALIEQITAHRPAAAPTV
ncbi:hypothetical protein [Paludibacterium paludis]|uniref:Uncharacterized protein n=1 Tax=Paludibacterium paludis TaxID=1225769 RepID=A0A918P592_9NEIS|nr:hypothetical protein [Paludibacterium paludis]GGY21119.1 hypothetical protein GCM10011289_26010 [Paludibacterium paludis]